MERGLRSQDDTAKAGSSCLTGAERRLVDQDNFNLLDIACLVVLWDATKFYDYIEYDILARECNNLDYGPNKLAYTIAMHAAPRILKFGTAMGHCMGSMGRSLVAGCVSSTSMGRGYTHDGISDVR